MQIFRMLRLPPGSMGQVIRMRNVSALNDLNHQAGIGDLSNVCKVS